MTNCIAKSLKNKNKLYKTYLNNPCKRNKNLYKRYKNILNHVIKVSKRIYSDEEQLIEYKQDTIWKWNYTGQPKNRLSSLTPIFKANENNKFENHWPISVLTWFSKLLGRLTVQKTD